MTLLSLFDISTWSLGDWIALFSALIAAIAALAYGIWRVFKLYNRFTGMEDECIALPEMKKTVEFNKNLNLRIEKTLDDNLLPKLDGIEKSLVSIKTFMDTKGYNEDIMRPGSPLELTDLGKKILEQSSGQIMIDTSYDFFEREIDKKNPKGLLDIQNFSKLVVMEVVNTEIFTGVKDFMYLNPVLDGVTLTIPTMVDVCGLYLRDKYIEKHPELTEEVT